MKIFFDCEFTGLHQHTTLVSIGCVTDDGRQFYAESKDYDSSQITPWLEQNVIAHLMPGHWLEADDPVFNDIEEGRLISVIGHNDEIANLFREWVAQFDEVEMWSDVLAYDWVLFCELFEAEDTAERLPRNIYYIPFDIATLMKIKGVDPDISREKFSGVAGHVKHNALDDARIIKACYNKLMDL